VVTTFPQAIADHFLDQARWRSEKANEYPDDYRNVQCADGLEGLATYVLALPADDERVIELGTLAVREGMFMPFSEGARLVSRFGFDDPNEDSGAFLDRLVRVTREEALTFAREQGVLPD